METAKNVKNLKVASKNNVKKLVAENEAETTVKNSFLELSDEQLTKLLESKNIESKILQTAEKSANIWKDSSIKIDGERKRNLVTKLRKRQESICKSVKHYNETNNKTDLQDSLLILLDFSKKNLKDIKNYVGAQRNAESSKLCKYAYDLLFNAKI